jgi:hypothetical protein
VPVSKELTRQVEAAAARNLSDDEQIEIEAWQRGRRLAHTANSPGWDDVLDLLKHYSLQESSRLLSITPGDKDAILGAHAVAFAAERIYRLFVEDVQSSILLAREVPPVITDNLRSPAPPESM